MEQTVTITPGDLDHFRLMLREQVAGDSELLADITNGWVDDDPAPVRERIDVVWRLAAQVGGIY